VIRVCSLTELPPGEAVRVTTGEAGNQTTTGEAGNQTTAEAHVPIAVFNADGELYAIDDTCSHQDASLADGWLEGCFVECPLHASTFDLRTGAPTCLPAKRSVRTYPIVVLDDVVYVNTAAQEDVA